MMTIGEVLDALENADPNGSVYFDFGGFVPEKVDSWRGIYSEPALGYTRDYKDAINIVQGLINELENAIDGRKYTGWKGGDYTYTRDSPLHIDNPGDCSSTEIVRVEDCGWRVVIHTTIEE
jgi:hypothetical protein